MNWDFSLTYLYFDDVERGQHLGNTKKNEFSFGASLGLHYLCIPKEKLYV